MKFIWLFGNCRGNACNAGPRPSLHRIRRLGLGPTIEHTTAIPKDPFILSGLMEMGMRRVTSSVFGFFMMMLVGGVVFSETMYPLETVKQQAQFTHLLRELRCLVCQNQDLADSNAGLAKDLRLEVYDMVKAGKSDHDIIDYLTARYGDFILFKPPVKAITALLWFGPLLLMAMGLFIFWHTCLRRVVTPDE